MTEVVITRNDRIEAAAAELGLDPMRVPVVSLREAIGIFTEAAYGRRVDFGHA
jgi:hypothetical protein